MRKSERICQGIIANETLYQLSYTPTVRCRTKRNTTRKFFSKGNQLAFASGGSG